MSTAVVPTQDADSRYVEVSRSSSTAAHSSLYPILVTIFGRITPELELIQPLEIAIERETDGSYIASDDIFNMFGQGVTASESVRDYLKVLIEFYRHLSADTDEPSMALFQFLQGYMQSVRR